MPIKTEVIDVENKNLEKRRKLYKQCDSCGELYHVLPLYVSINQDYFHYANVVRCANCNKIYAIIFLKKNIPALIDKQELRDKIAKHQKSAFVGRYYDYSELKNGMLIKPLDGETLDEFKARWKQRRKDYYAKKQG